jgi:hypothetical protein
MNPPSPVFPQGRGEGKKARGKKGVGRCVLILLQQKTRMIGKTKKEQVLDLIVSAEIGKIIGKFLVAEIFFCKNVHCLVVLILRNRPLIYFEVKTVCMNGLLHYVEVVITPLTKKLLA